VVDNKQPELKPCPFCGGEAKKTSQYIVGDLITWAQCQNKKCGASANIPAWNTRHGDL
jgi:hypothetical protein